MSKVFCARAECKHNKGNICKAKEVKIRAWEIDTVNYGMKRMDECLTYEMSEEFKEIKASLDEFFQEQSQVKCKECEYLMFSDFDGECSKGYKGIVSPNDSCGKGKRSKKVVGRNENHT